MYFFALDFWWSESSPKIVLNLLLEIKLSHIFPFSHIYYNNTKISHYTTEVVRLRRTCSWKQKLEKQKFFPTFRFFQLLDFSNYPSQPDACPDSVSNKPISMAGIQLKVFFFAQTSLVWILNSHSTKWSKSVI